MTGPFFVVGSSRSGTNLLRAIFNRHSAVWVSAETHYFDDLRLRLGGGSHRLDERGRQLCEGYFLALSHRAYGRGGSPQQSRISAAELRDRAAELGGTADAHFHAFCELRARQHEKLHWAEKTPRHVYRIADILGAFPDAKVVGLVRDPRAVVTSYRDWHLGEAREGLDDEDAAGIADERARSKRSYNTLLMSLLWRGVIRAEHEALRSFGPERIRLQHFEALAADPRGSIEDLCNWLGIDFEPAMLDVPVVNSSYATQGKGVSRAPVTRWQQKLTPSELAIVERCCGGLMDELGYERACERPEPLRYVAAWLVIPYATLRAALVNRRRLGKAVAYIRRRGRFALSSRPLVTQTAGVSETRRRDS